MDVRELMAPTIKEAVPNSKAGPGSDARKTVEGSPFSSLFAGAMQKNNPVTPEDETDGENAKTSRLVFAPVLMAGLNLADPEIYEMSDRQPIPDETEALNNEVSVMMADSSIQAGRGQIARHELLKEPAYGEMSEAAAPEEDTKTVPVSKDDTKPPIAARQKDEPLEAHNGFTVSEGRSAAQSERVFKGGNTEEEVVKDTPEGKLVKDTTTADLTGRMKTAYRESQTKPQGKEERITGTAKTEIEIKSSIEFNPDGKPEAVETGDDFAKIVQRHAIDTEKPEFTAEVVERVKVMVNSKRSEVSVQLKPESLGKMSFKLEVVDGVLNGKITVHNSQAREVLQANLGQLRDNLEQSGIPVSKLTVSIGSHGEFRHHQFSQENGHEPGGYTGRWAVPGYREEEATEEAFRWNNVGTVEYLA